MSAIPKAGTLVSQGWCDVMIPSVGESGRRSESGRDQRAYRPTAKGVAQGTFAPPPT
ncbi:MAG: hypothetical protein H0V18_14030 [Pyrinomonadaceae bacterium]|nr:hypothetical protein [Pyrinomonadaceae bacterium]